MKLIIALSALSVVAAYSLPTLKDVDSEWFSFKANYGKIYKSILEEQQRKEIFANNYNLIKKHNELYQSGESTYFLKINHLADLNTAERSYMTGYKKNQTLGIDIDNFTPDPNVAVPDYIDWREHGAVTRVKDQQQCGSCWVFSSTGSLEGLFFMRTGNLVELSEQNILDCCQQSSGCDGGDMVPAFAYIYDNGGIDSESSYPYEAVQGSCRYNPSNMVTTVRGYGLVSVGNEYDLKAAVGTLGPISIAIDASQTSFFFYGGGVYNEPNCQSINLNHAVLAAGYGTENGVDYWLVKNSWSANWGDQGYIKMIRNQNNWCGVATEGVYPLLY